MTNTVDILISVENRHIQNMLKGVKTIELRRRPIRIPKGSRVWLYAKIPEGKICACGIVRSIVEDTPEMIWKNYGDVSGLQKSEFQNYFSNSKNACAILFESVVPLKYSISLNEMRKNVEGFHPPQFFKFLQVDSSELKLLENKQTAA